MQFFSKNCGIHNAFVLNILYINLGVKWLTPTEGERAMGLPDGWTAFGHDGRPVSARARQKALGNSIALPCAEYIMAGVKEELEGGKPYSDI